MPFDLEKFYEIVKQYVAVTQKTQDREKIDILINSYSVVLAASFEKIDFKQLKTDMLKSLMTYAATINLEAVTGFEQSKKSTGEAQSLVKPPENLLSFYLRGFDTDRQKRRIKSYFERGWKTIDGINSTESTERALKELLKLRQEVKAAIDQKKERIGCFCCFFGETPNFVESFYQWVERNCRLLQGFFANAEQIRANLRLVLLEQNKLIETKTETIKLKIENYVFDFASRAHPEVNSAFEQKHAGTMQEKINVLEEQFPEFYKEVIEKIKEITTLDPLKEVNDLLAREIDNLLDSTAAETYKVAERLLNPGSVEAWTEQAAAVVPSTRGSVQTSIASTGTQGNIPEQATMAVAATFPGTSMQVQQDAGVGPTAVDTGLSPDLDQSSRGLLFPHF